MRAALPEKAAGLQSPKGTELKEPEPQKQYLTEPPKQRAAYAGTVCLD